MTPTSISEGHWVFRKPHWAGPFTAYDRRTGITHTTDAMTIQDVRAFADAHDQSTQDTEAYTAERVAITYTIAPGGRARGGHQRFTGGEERTAG